ncbi:EF-P beta-lysylation protein EpmB [Thermostilla marina]
MRSFIWTPPGNRNADKADLPRTPTWKREIAAAITDPAVLCRELRLPETLAEAARRADGGFRLLVPRPFVRRMRPGDPNDPLLRQVLPVPEELESVEGYTIDPLDEREACRSPGLLQKYRNRSLIVLTRGCPVHCRYCFRRHFTPSVSRLDADHTGPVSDSPWAAIADDPSIHEVILSGGEPLTADDSTLAKLIRNASQIRHLRRIRIHTRMPIVIPSRVTPELIDILRRARPACFVAVHVNHPAEIDTEVTAALAALIDNGIPVLTQTVLLRGINDSADVLTDLFEKLVDLRAIPYYLHQLDRVSGAAHFDTPEELGRAIVRELRQRLPGYAVPRFVREVPGAEFKMPLA